MPLAVVFDLDETLLDRTRSLRAFLAGQHHRFQDALGHVPFDAWQERFLALDARGSVPKSRVYAGLAEEFGVRATIVQALLEDYLTHCSRHALPFDGMRATLEALRASGRRLGIVTNGDTDFQTRHVEALGLDRLVDAVLVSEAEGLRKPDARLFHRAAARLGCPPAQCLFIGDNPAADILGAHAAGFQTAWFRCGQAWPAQLPPNPGPTIEHLSELLHRVC